MHFSYGLLVTSFDAFYTLCKMELASCETRAIVEQKHCLHFSHRLLHSKISSLSLTPVPLPELINGSIKTEMIFSTYLPDVILLCIFLHDTVEWMNRQWNWDLSRLSDRNGFHHFFFFVNIWISFEFLCGFCLVDNISRLILQIWLFSSAVSLAEAEKSVEYMFSQEWLHLAKLSSERMIEVNALHSMMKSWLSIVGK